MVAYLAFLRMAHGQQSLLNLLLGQRYYWITSSELLGNIFALPLQDKAILVLKKPLDVRQLLFVFLDWADKNRAMGKQKLWHLIGLWKGNSWATESLVLHIWKDCERNPKFWWTTLPSGPYSVFHTSVPGNLLLRKEHTLFGIMELSHTDHIMRTWAAP